MRGGVWGGGGGGGVEGGGALCLETLLIIFCLRTHSFERQTPHSVD